MSTRVEKDSMGGMNIPEKALYGATTQRAVENFPVSSLRFSPHFIKSLGQIKDACAKANLKLKKIDPRLGKAISQACHEIAKGNHLDQFVLDIFQTGSGTSTNMNFNEVAANLANLKLGSKLGTKSPVHPNDHVNLGQSSNDIIPTTIHVASATALQRELLPAIEKLKSSLEKKSKAFKNMIKVGRTHLQDATPLTLGQEFSGYGHQLQLAIERMEIVLPRLCELAIGGTAVGTGINTHPQFAKRVCEELKSTLKLPFKECRNHFAAQGSLDTAVELSGALRALAVSLTKISNDIRWLSSGPRAGLGELVLPKVQPGSSIMPGKANPVMAEMLLQICVHVQGNDLAISLGGMNGNFELNTMMPLIAHHLLESIEFLTKGILLFEEKCVEGIQANEERMRTLMEQSLMLVTALVPEVGYDEAARLANKAYQEGLTIREVVKLEGKIPEAKLEKLLDPKNLVSSKT